MGVLNEKVSCYQQFLVRTWGLQHRGVIPDPQPNFENPGVFFLTTPAGDPPANFVDQD